MELVWAANAPGFPGTSTAEHRTFTQRYLSRMEDLLAHGEGHTEVGFADPRFPYLTMGFREGHAVLHHFSDDDKILLLRWGGRSRNTGTVSLPIGDLDGEFDTAFVIPLADAWGIVRSFLETGSVPRPGEWVQL